MLATGTIGKVVSIDENDDTLNMEIELMKYIAQTGSENECCIGEQIWTKSECYVKDNTFDVIHTFKEGDEIELSEEYDGELGIGTEGCVIRVDTDDTIKFKITKLVFPEGKDESVYDEGDESPWISRFIVVHRGSSYISSLPPVEVKDIDIDFGDVFRKPSWLD